MLKSLLPLLFCWLGLTGQSIGNSLNPTWFGIWKSSDGELLKISADRMTWRDGSQTRHAIWDPTDSYSIKAYDQGQEESPGGFNYVYESAGNTQRRASVSPAELMKRFDDAKKQEASGNSDMQVLNPVSSRKAISSFRPGRYSIVYVDFGSPCQLNGAMMIVDGPTMLVYYEGAYAYWAKTFRKV